MRLVVLMLALTGCASNSPPDRPSLPPLPEAVTMPPSAAQEGSLTKQLQDGLNESVKDLRRSLGLERN
jgi:hypothetical protein